MKLFTKKIIHYKPCIYYKYELGIIFRTRQNLRFSKIRVRLKYYEQILNENLRAKVGNEATTQKYTTCINVLTF